MRIFKNNLVIISYWWMKISSKLIGSDKVYSAQVPFGLPLIVVRDEEVLDKEKTINHEKIHIKQSLWLGVVLFMPLYLLNFLVNLLVYRNAEKAYYNVCFEREAYDNDQNLDYLETRKPYAWVKYVLKKTGR